MKKLNFVIRMLESKLAMLESRLPPTTSYPDIKFRTYKDRKRILITGGAGFVGSHLVDKGTRCSWWTTTSLAARET